MSYVIVILVSLTFGYVGGRYEDQWLPAATQWIHKMWGKIVAFDAARKKKGNE